MFYLEPPDRQPPNVVLDELWSALHAEYPDRYWCHAGELVELQGDRLISVSAADLAAPLARSVSFVSGPRDKPEECKHKAPGPEFRVQLVSDAARGCRHLEGVVRTPVLTEHGLLYRPGYEPKTRLWLHWEGPAPDPSAVTDAQLVDAVSRLLDFPFETTGDKVHALGLYLQALVRPSIPGATPLWAIVAEHEQAGKSYLAKCVGAVALGRYPDERGLDKWASEASRQLAAYLLASPTFLLLENLPTRGLVGGSDLHRYLTANGPVGVRPVGSGTEKLVDVRCTWLTTVNSPDFDPEQARRTVQVKLRHVPHREFRTPDLAGWILQNRSLVVSALLRIALHWDRSGRPNGPRALASFEGWSRVLGGILEQVPGFEGHFLGESSRPLPKVHRETLELFRAWPQAQNLEALLAGRVEAEFRPEWMGAGSLLSLVRQRGLESLIEVVGDGSERSQTTKLGNYLKRLVEEGRLLGGYRLQRRNGSNGAEYRPVLADETQAGTNVIPFPTPTPPPFQAPPPIPDPVPASVQQELPLAVGGDPETLAYNDPWPVVDQDPDWEP